MPVVRDEYVCALIARAKKRRGITSDNQLAERMGLTRATVSAWQTGRSAPEGPNLLALCELAAEDAAYALTMIQSGRARTPEERKLWAGIARRLTPAKIAALFALVFVAASLVPEPASAQPVQAASHSLLYASCLLAVLLRRLVARTRGTV